MSFSRYYTVGYGFEVDVIGSIDALDSHRFEHEDEEKDTALAYELDDLEDLLARNYPRLETIFAGDHSGGNKKEQKQWVVLKDTVVQLWSDQVADTFDIQELIQASQDETALRQLFDFNAYTGVAIGDLQWVIARSESY